MLNSKIAQTPSARLTEMEAIAPPAPVLTPGRTLIAITIRSLPGARHRPHCRSQSCRTSAWIDDQFTFLRR